MRMVRRFSIAVALVAMPVGAALAQQGPGGLINPHRDCQTILTCQFKKGGSYRGCLSSYSCRTCAFVTSNCKIAGSRGQVCQRLRCTWGG
jgi:hypothetical protein